MAMKKSISRSNQSPRRLRTINLDQTKPALNRGSIRSISGSWSGTVGAIVLLGLVLLPSSSAAQGNGVAERVSQLETQVAAWQIQAKACSGARAWVSFLAVGGGEKRYHSRRPDGNRVAQDL